MTWELKKELQSEIEKLYVNLNRIFEKIDDVDNDVKALAGDMKDIKSDIAGMGRELSDIQAIVRRNESEIKELKEEDKTLWNYFPEHKADMKEYAGIIAKQEADKIKIWVYSLMGLGAVMIITNLVMVLQK